MATTPPTRTVEYPTSDGKPMAETDLHRDVMIEAITTLEDHFAADPRVYVSGNILLYYEEGNSRKSLSPDVLVARGVAKEPRREYYLVWREGKVPDVVLEVTSKKTRRNDQGKKLVLYRDVLRVPEYFQFDPRDEYLKPPLQGYRLARGQYLPIAAVAGRLPSAVLGLHLERDGTWLRFYDPAAGRYLLTRAERVEAERLQKVAECQRADAADQRADAADQRADAQRQRAERAEAELERLRREVEELRRRQAPGD
jgi:Uma2 family endonuclease